MDKNLHQRDLKDVSEWLGVDNLAQINTRMKTVPIGVFIKQIEEMEGTFLEFPEDEDRVNKILSLIKDGEEANPVYVEEDDAANFIMEGRHRIVAFHRAGLKDIAVCFCRKI